MRIGVMFGGSREPIPVRELIERVRDIEARGFDTAWVPNVFGNEAMATAALLGHATETIEIGTAVVPTQPRHPVALAQQALTAAAASGGRFTLGIGLSHPAVIEGMFGLSWARKVSHMREYLAVLGPLLRGEAVQFSGEEFRVQASLDVPGADRVGLVIAALGEKMLDLAGRESDGTILWMSGLRTIETHIAPRIQAAAREAGRAAPRIIAGMHICLTEKPDEVNDKIAEMVGLYRMMPSYGAMLEVEGNADPASLALVGDEAALDRGLQRLHEIGVTDFEASIFAPDREAYDRTVDYLASVAGRKA